MIPLLSEVQAMQNPALGAVLMWRFCCACSPEDGAREGVELPLVFTVLPIVLHERTRGEVEGTLARSGIRKFEQKFAKQNDLLLALNDRAIAMRQLSMRSIGIAMAAGLLTLVPEQARLWPRTYSRPKNVPASITPLISASEKLGTWCSPMSVYEVSGIFRVEF